MIVLLWFGLAILFSPFRPRWRVEVENVALRNQVMVLRRQARGRIHLTNFDRLFLVRLYRWFPSVLRVVAIIQPETVIRWPRAGFRLCWRWKSRSRGGRPNSPRQDFVNNDPDDNGYDTDALFGSATVINERI